MFIMEIKRTKQAGITGFKCTKTNTAAKLLQLMWKTERNCTRNKRRTSEKKRTHHNFDIFFSFIRVPLLPSNLFV